MQGRPDPGVQNQASPLCPSLKQQSRYGKTFSRIRCRADPILESYVRMHTEGLQTLLTRAHWLGHQLDGGTYPCTMENYTHMQANKNVNTTLCSKCTTIRNACKVYGLTTLHQQLLVCVHKLVRTVSDANRKNITKCSKLLYM